MFGIVRMIFWLIVLWVSFRVLGKRGHLNKTRNRIFLLVSVILLWTGSGLVPVENLFISFPTPEKSYNYVNREKVELVVYGQKSALVIGEGKETVLLIVPKGEKGWKVGRGLDLKFASSQYFGGIVVRTYQYKDTDEFYVAVSDINGIECNVSDNQNSRFEVLATGSLGKNRYCRYYAYVPDLSDDYVLNVNGNEIVLEN